MPIFSELYGYTPLERRERFIRVTSWVCLAILGLTTLPQPFLGMWRIMPFMGIAMLLFGIGIWLCHHQRVNQASRLLPFSISVLIVVISFLIGKEAGTYLYFLPLMIAIPFFADTSNTLQLIIHILYSTAFMLFINFTHFPPVLPEITPYTQVFFEKLNLIIVLLLSQFFVYEIISTNTKSENLLRLSEQKLRSQHTDLQEINQELDRFVYSISHDLRAPVASALGLVELMREETDQEELQDYNQIMHKNLLRLDQFIRDILDYSHNLRFAIRQDAIWFEEEIKATIQQYQFMEEANGVEVSYTVHQETPFTTDRYRLRVILNNLISNAFRYQNPAEPQKWIHVSCTVSAGNSVVKIRDNGIGIAREEIPHLFTMFYRANPGTTPGSGLGLYIARESAHKIQGTIKVISEKGRFTEFTIQLPESSLPD